MYIDIGCIGIDIGCLGIDDINIGCIDIHIAGNDWLQCIDIGWNIGCMC